MPTYEELADLDAKIEQARIADGESLPPARPLDAIKADPEHNDGTPFLVEFDVCTHAT